MTADTPSALSKPLYVRLPVDVLEELEAESVEDGIPVSTLIRRAVIRERRNMRGDGENSVRAARDTSRRS
jgi:hypothetical protein